MKAIDHERLKTAVLLCSAPGLLLLGLWLLSPNVVSGNAANPAVPDDVMAAAIGWTPVESLVSVSVSTMDLDAGDKGVYLSWANDSGNRFAYYRQYDSVALSWGTPIPIVAGVSKVDIDASGDEVGAVCLTTDMDVIYADLDGTTVITTDVGLPPSSSFDLQISPALAMGPQPHVVWTARVSGEFRVYYTNRYTGTTWLTPTVVYSGTGGAVNSGFAIESLDNQVFLGWEHGTGTRIDLWFVEGTLDSQGRVTWTVPISLTAGTPVTMPYSVRLDLLMDLTRDKLYATWASCEVAPPHINDPQYIFFSERALSGGSWSTPVQVAMTYLHNIVTTYPSPRLASNDEGIYLVWHGRREGLTTPGEDVAWSASLDGATWGTARNLSGTPNTLSVKPVNACPGSVCHVAWIETGIVYWRHTVQSNGLYLPLILKNG
jgi:hypothetical protein